MPIVFRMASFVLMCFVELYIVRLGIKKTKLNEMEYTFVDRYLIN